MKNEINSVICSNPLSIEKQIMKSKSKIHFLETDTNLPEILFISSCTPRECGIATYSEDLIKALENKFNRSFKIKSTTTLLCLGLYCCDDAFIIKIIDK